MIDAVRLGEDAIVREDLVDSRAATRWIVFTKDVIKITGKQSRYRVGHGILLFARTQHLSHSHGWSRVVAENQLSSTARDHVWVGALVETSRMKSSNRFHARAPQRSHCRRRLTISEAFRNKRALSLGVVCDQPAN